MLNLNKRLKALASEGRVIRVGLVGAGQMGSVIVAQTLRLSGIRVVAIADVMLERAYQAYIAAGVTPDAIRIVEAVEDLDESIALNLYSVTSTYDILIQSMLVDIIVEATGIPAVGAEVAFRSILARKHIVTLNAEADATVGPYLAKFAREQGVVYTGSAGDEPGAIKELIDFADSLGLEVLVAGKGKNNPLDPFVTPDRLRSEAEEKQMNVKMLTSFVDGTKTMVEMTCLANATGFIPDRPGMYGVSASLDNVVEHLKLKREGGVLNRYGVVEFVHGIAPGVFVIVRSVHSLVDHLLRYLKIGKGPNYLLYRPFHLVSLETPISIALAYLNGEATIAPQGAPVAETVAIAKRDLEAGDVLDGLGGYTVYGLIISAQEAREQGALPIGLALPGARLKRKVLQGRLLTYDDVDLPHALIVELRREQDRLFDAS